VEVRICGQEGVRSGDLWLWMGWMGFGLLDCWLQGAGEYVANAEMVSKCIQLHLVLSIWYQFTQLSDWGNPAKKLFPLSHSSS